MGVAHEVSGRFAEAQDCFEQSLALLKELGDRRNFGFMLNNLGVIAHLGADYGEAARRYTEALEIFREIGERTWELPTLGNLAGAQIGQAEYAAAGCFAESLRVYTGMGAAAERARTLRDRARHELAHGDPARGAEMWREARAVFTRLGMARELERMPE